MFLSRKGIKYVTRTNHHPTPLKLPSHLFSCLELTHLSLHNCSFHPPPNFHGFPNLLSLRLVLVRFESYKCGEFITRRPLLKNLFTKLDITTPVTTFSIFQLVGFFPKLEILYLDFKNCKAQSNNDVPPPAIRSSALDCITTGRLQLRNVLFSGFRGSENEVCLIKSLLACYPLLKTMRIELNSSSMIGGADGKFMFASKLLKLYRASPSVKIDLM